MPTWLRVVYVAALFAAGTLLYAVFSDISLDEGIKRTFFVTFGAAVYAFIWKCPRD